MTARAPQQGAPPAEPVSWLRIAVPAYGPTVLVSIGQGAILPLVALSARDLGASVGLAAFVVALVGLGQLVGDLPAGALAARIGEQRALVLSLITGRNSPVVNSSIVELMVLRRSSRDALSLNCSSPRRASRSGREDEWR